MATHSSDDWYFRVGELEMGPIKFEELLQYATGQQITADDHVKFGPDGKWRKVGSIGRLMAVLPFQTQVAAPKRELAVAGIGSLTPSESQRPVAVMPAQFVPVASAVNHSAVPAPKAAAAFTQIPASAVNTSANNSMSATNSNMAAISSTNPTMPAISNTAVEPRPTAVETVAMSIPQASPPTSAPAASSQPISSDAPRVVEPPAWTPPRPIPSTPTYRVGSPVATPYRQQRPVPAKYAARSAGPGLAEQLKQLLSGEYQAHAIGLAAAVAFLAFWCYPRGPVRPVAVHPVKGSVVMDGQPLANAAVVLHPVARSKDQKKMPVNVQPKGKAAPDGTFALGTFDPADGAPEGDFVATVYLVEETETNGEKNFSDNLLPAIYGDPGTSPFKVKITSATKVLEPLQLTSNGP